MKNRLLIFLIAFIVLLAFGMRGFYLGVKSVRDSKPLTSCK